MELAFNRRTVRPIYRNMRGMIDVNRPGMSGDSSSWKGWGHVRWFIEEVPAGAA
ncbi:CRISPR-associated protein [Mycobacterium tuberculosis]|nr:CRISPR-associated protein [Mycobacterium tuberculosis]